MTKTVLGSENTQYGFYGTIYSRNSENETESKWAEAFELLLDLSGLSPYEIRAYLDSRSGRKLADCCNDSKVIRVMVCIIKIALCELGSIYT